MLYIQLRPLVEICTVKKACRREPSPLLARSTNLNFWEKDPSPRRQHFDRPMTKNHPIIVWLAKTWDEDTHYYFDR
jgi:hypothetical protein